MVKDFQHRTMILRLKPALREKKSWDFKQFQNKKKTCATHGWNSFTFLANGMVRTFLCQRFRICFQYYITIQCHMFSFCPTHWHLLYVSQKICNYETLKFLLLCLHDYYVINIDCLILLMIGIQIRLTKVH